MKALLLFLLFFFVWPSTSFPAQRIHLHHHISDFELIHYNGSTLLANHQRVVQGLDAALNFSFQAFGRTFDLNLFPEQEVFSSTHALIYSDGTVQDVDVSHLYQGTVRGVPGSSVHLSVLDGQVQGYIVLPGETTYYIEPAIRHFSQLPSDTLIYDRKNLAELVEADERHTQKDLQCNEEDWLSLRDSYDLCIEETPRSTTHNYAVNDRTNISPKHGTHYGQSSRQNCSSLFSNNVCNLHMYADPTLWRYFKYQRSGKVLNNRKTAAEILKFFAGHVSTLKRIFGSTEFTTYDGSQLWRGVDFTVDRSTLMTDKTEKCNTSRARLLCQPDISDWALRRYMATRNHDEYCLAIYFTYRDFLWTFGQAARASRLRPGAGICDRCVEELSGNRTVYKSGNVLWVTLVGNGVTIPDSVSHLILAHEVGHAFGSPHDDGPDCVPGKFSPAGNYLMYRKRSSGSKENNDKFSICSKDNITRVLSSVIYGKYGRYNCFKPSVSGGGLSDGSGDTTPAFCSGEETTTHPPQPSQQPKSNSQSKFPTHTWVFLQAFSMVLFVLN